MNLQIDMAWNEYAGGCGPTALKGCTQACPRKQAWLPKRDVPAGRQFLLLPGQEPIVSALLFRKSTQAEQQCPRPPVNIPCSVHDSEDVKPWEMEMGWAGWGVLWSLAFTSLLVWAGQLHHSVCQSGTGHVATWTWGVTWLIFVPALRLPTCTCTDWKQGENCSFLLKKRFCWRKKGTGDTLAIH